MAKTAEAAVTRKARSQAAEVWRQFRRNKGAMIGSAIVLVIVFIATTDSKLEPVLCDSFS